MSRINRFNTNLSKNGPLIPNVCGSTGDPMHGAVFAHSSEVPGCPPQYKQYLLSLARFGILKFGSLGGAFAYAISLMSHANMTTDHIKNTKLTTMCSLRSFDHNM